MALHLYKHKETGREVELDSSFSNLEEAKDWKDLGEAVIVKDPNTGINHAKLVSEVEADANPKQALVNLEFDNDPNKGKNPEPDEKDKRIAELEAELKKAQEKAKSAKKTGTPAKSEAPGNSEQKAVDLGPQQPVQGNQANDVANPANTEGVQNPPVE